jgi:uncharacterized protein
LTITTQRLSTDDLRRLAAGSDPSVSRALIRGQYAKNVLLLRFVLDRLPPSLADARATLTAASESDRVAFADLLVEPMISAWLSRTAGLLDAGAADPGLSRVTGVAVAAAVRCRVDVEVAVTPVDGRVGLPTLGVAGTEGAAVVRVRNGTLHLLTAGDWQPVRPLIDRPDGRPLLVLDDLDPYRDMYGVPVSQRIDSGAYALWRSTADAAWRLLADHAPESAADLAEGIRVAVPLTGSSTGKALSITARRAFGAFGLTRPESSADFAGTLVHEYQHSKLNAVLDMTRIEDGTDTGRYFAPWRDDPRPLHGMLHGIYAFLGLARCWHRLTAAPGLAELAEERFAETRLWVSAALDQVQHSAALTDAGRAFTSGLRQALDELLGVDLPSAAVAAGQRSLRQLRRSWELRNER